MVLADTNINIRQLLGKCNDQEEVALALQVRGESTIQYRCHLCVHLSVSNAEAAAAKAIAKARMATNPMTPGTALTTAQYVDDAVAIVSFQNDALKSLRVVLSKLDLFINIINGIANIHPYAKAAWEVVSVAYTAVKDQTVRDQKVVDLVAAMERAYSFVDILAPIQHKIELLEGVIRNILCYTVVCARFVQEYSARGFGRRMLEGTLKLGDAKRIEDLSNGLNDLETAFQSAIDIQTALDASELATKTHLLELKPAEMDNASGRTECLPCTRQDILSHIIDWANNVSDTRNVLWVHGLAGSGKSTIATTVASHFRNLGYLGAFLFFDRSFPERSRPSKVIRTLAYKLGSFDPRIGPAVLAAIKKFPSIIDSSLHIQFINLLVKPLSSVTFHPGDGPVVLVLDALDECGNAAERTALLEIMGMELSRLPLAIRVLITSRAMEDIREAFSSKPNILVQMLDVSSETNDLDISTYFRHQMALIGAKHDYLGSGWPGEDHINELVSHACGLFVWASTASRFIDAYDPREHLDAILKGPSRSGAEAALDALYTTALEAAGLWDDDVFQKDFRAIFGMVLVLRTPLTSPEIDQLLGARKGRESMRLILMLACVLSHSPNVRMLHPSFADFLFSKRQCGRDIWTFEAESCHRHVADHCLRRLDGVLKRNMCNLSISTDLEDEMLPKDVGYACAFWIDHVQMVKEDIPSLLNQVEAFLNQHLLHWFEAISILRKSREAIAQLHNFAGWISINAPDRKSLFELACDAHRFAQTFAKSIEEHPLLVYLSALPFTPTSSVIYQKFHDAQSFPTVSGGFEKSWSPMLLVLAGHGAGVESAVFSPDGTRVISGSRDGSIRIWDANSGAQILPALQGHDSKEWVTSIAVSPDGNRIISGSTDQTVRVWDIHSGAQIPPLMRGHKAPVWSVACSPDGRRIVSGSSDNTVRVWDTESGAEVFPALRGHNRYVGWVAFSPDGASILSVSRDKTIRMWDATSGATLLILEGHDDEVESVTFSPGGTRIISGSADKTVRVWCAKSGIEVLPALRGHDSDVTSVAISSDGARIVSGSGDTTIRVWDANSGAEIIPVLRGHEDFITSVAFSPDGARIVSGSEDRTIRVWDASPAVKSSSVAQRHHSLVKAVIFSRDGARVTSSSGDNTIRVWNTASGDEISVLRGHESSIQSHAFSPDGTRIVSISSTGNLRMWDAELGTGLLEAALRVDYDYRFSVAFSPDGTQIRLRIMSKKIDDTLIWDASTGIQIPSTTPSKSPPRPVSKPPSAIGITADGWIIHRATDRTLSKLPAIIRGSHTATHESWLTLGTKGGQVIIMHFPPAIFSGEETRAFEGKKREIHEHTSDSSGSELYSSASGSDEEIMPGSAPSVFR